jgi:hypothetical protein
MPAMLLLLAAAAPPNLPLVIRDPPRGPMPAENHTFSQPHNNMDDRMFPDIAVKDLRVDGDTLYVQVANQGGVRASGPIRLVARAEANGIKSEAADRQAQRRGETVDRAEVVFSPDGNQRPGNASVCTTGCKPCRRDTRTPDWSALGARP